jgi:hypothetical protein
MATGVPFQRGKKSEMEKRRAEEEPKDLTEEKVVEDEDLVIRAPPNIRQHIHAKDILYPVAQADMSAHWVFLQTPKQRTSEQMEILGIDFPQGSEMMPHSVSSPFGKGGQAACYPSTQGGSILVPAWSRLC